MTLPGRSGTRLATSSAFGVRVRRFGLSSGVGARVYPDQPQCRHETLESSRITRYPMQRGQGQDSLLIGVHESCQGRRSVDGHPAAYHRLEGPRAPAQVRSKHTVKRQG